MHLTQMILVDGVHHDLGQETTVCVNNGSYFKYVMRLISWKTGFCFWKIL